MSKHLNKTLFLFKTFLHNRLLIYTTHTKKATISKFYSKKVVLKCFMDGKYTFLTKKVQNEQNTSSPPFL